MKTAQHTPGPWHNIGDSQIHAQHANQNGLHVATIWAHGVTQTQGNARLIAAAPDLLAALQECLTDDGARCLNDDKHGEYARRRLYAINDTVRAAIAKATGN